MCRMENVKITVILPLPIECKLMMTTAINVIKNCF